MVIVGEAFRNGSEADVRSESIATSFSRLDVGGKSGVRTMHGKGNEEDVRRRRKRGTDADYWSHAHGIWCEVGRPCFGGFPDIEIPSRFRGDEHPADWGRTLQLV